MSPAERKLKHVIDYENKVSGVYNFVGKADGATWNGLFLMGLAMNGLDLIPYSSDITPQPYWKTAPEPKGEFQDWDISWIVEIDAFTKEYPS